MGTKNCKTRTKENRTGFGGDKNKGQGVRVLEVARKEGWEGRRDSSQGVIARGAAVVVGRKG